jgi:hypothetical protein
MRYPLIFFINFLIKLFRYFLLVWKYGSAWWEHGIWSCYQTARMAPDRARPVYRDNETSTSLVLLTQRTLTRPLRLTPNKLSLYKRLLVKIGVNAWVSLSPDSSRARPAQRRVERSIVMYYRAFLSTYVPPNLRSKVLPFRFQRAHVDMWCQHHFILCRC